MAIRFTMKASNTSVRLVASAKVNLTLSVIAKAPSGYHELVSAVCFTHFGDHLSATITDHNIASFHCELTGPFAATLQASGGDHLMQQAYELACEFASAFGYRIPGISVHLEKNIPLGGGLGGGSADAAALLRYLSADWQHTQKQDLRMAALELGADVPACFDNRLHIMSGYGEQRTALECPVDLPYLVLANPRCHSDTGAIFTSLADSGHKFADPSQLYDELQTIFAHADFRQLFAIGNDLARPATLLYPAIATLLEDMALLGQEAGAPFVGSAMSGSGASCFALIKGEAAANAYCDELQKNGYWAVATRFF